MARTPKNLALGQSTDALLNTIYTVPTGTNTSAAVLAFTNVSTDTIIISIYHGNGTDFLQKTLTIPAGVGRERVYFGFQQRVLNAAHTVKVQADSTSAFNFTFSGSEVEIA